MNPIDCGLPHREPFLFLDEVVEIVPGDSARGIKTFGPDEPFFRGHFPGNPIVPGVLLIEALAQIAGIAASRPGSALRLAAVKTMKFPRPVRPAQQVEVAARKLGEAGDLVQLAVIATVSGTPVAEGVVVLAEETAVHGL
jgi:3-hydroxyacyl-[acyl-carrier-protein] dehydratase